jgi:hypothetical protein
MPSAHRHNSLSEIFSRLVMVTVTSSLGFMSLAGAANETSKNPAEPSNTVVATKSLAEPGLSGSGTSAPLKACIETFEKLNLPLSKAKGFRQTCERAVQLTRCQSVKGTPIFHIDRAGRAPEGSRQKILVLSLIHGDEGMSATVAGSWLQRLSTIDPRNDWRIVPVLNPDGWETKTRTNANGIDINRNFPSRDWEKEALPTWKSRNESSPRRFPGEKAASEPETLCAIAEIEDFKPDFIISIHTPLGVLDFDGPRVPEPKFSPLKWTSIGNYPGSLGRYMWVDRNTPVLTVELKNQLEVDKSLEEFDRLQDISGSVAMESRKALVRKRENLNGG